MRVGISMLTLVPGAMGGSETYARGLCRGLAERGEPEAVAFVPAGAADASEGLPTVFVAEYAGGASPVAKIRGLLTAAVRPHSLRRCYHGIHVVHYPFTAPVPHLSVPTVITLHDVQHRDLPEMFSRGARLFRRLAYDRAARRADAVIVPSAFVRDRSVTRLGLRPERVHVVRHGVDLELFHPGEVEREPFLLYPARGWPHKNHARLLQAFVLLRRRRPELRLVLTGGGTESLAGPPGVDARGAVSALELSNLYRRAACLVFPSLYEGFGIPPLEAMACGTPVAAARAGSLPEICGDAAVLFDPYDPKDIAAGVELALERADVLERRGFALVTRYSWEAAVEGHVQAYAAALRTAG